MENLKLADLGKERFKRRIQTLDSQSIAWQTCEKIKPFLVKLRKQYSTKNYRSIWKTIRYQHNNNGVNLDSFFLNMFEWCESIVTFIEDRLKTRQQNMSS